MARKGKKDKAEGRERHKQLKKSRELKKKMKHKVELPARHRKGKK